MIDYVNPAITYIIRSRMFLLDAYFSTIWWHIRYTRSYHQTREEVNTVLLSDDAWWIRKCFMFRYGCFWLNTKLRCTHIFVSLTKCCDSPPEFFQALTNIVFFPSWGGCLHEYLVNHILTTLLTQTSCEQRADISSYTCPSTSEITTRVCAYLKLECTQFIFSKTTSTANSILAYVQLLQFLIIQIWVRDLAILPMWWSRMFCCCA